VRGTCETYPLGGSPDDQSGELCWVAGGTPICVLVAIPAPALQALVLGRDGLGQGVDGLQILGGGQALDLDGRKELGLQIAEHALQGLDGLAAPAERADNRGKARRLMGPS
jgi:hypothetical protein